MLDHERFLKFSVAGISGLLVDMGILFVLVDALPMQVPVTPAKLIAAESAMINNFTWNHAWTFRERRMANVPLIRRFLRFNLVCGTGIVIAVIVLHILHAGLGANLYLSNLIAISASAGWNYLMSVRYVWRSGN